MDSPIRIELFGALRVIRGDSTISHFPTLKTGALLGYLAYHFDRLHPREVLCELFWPGKSPPAGRASLSMALTSLRHQLEPPDVPPGAIIRANRFSVGLNPQAVATDVAEFRALLREAESADAARRISLLSRAVSLCRGELLEGYYDDWLMPEQRRLSARAVSAAISLARACQAADQAAAAIEAVRFAVARDSAREELHLLLVGLLARNGDSVGALRAWDEMARALRSELGVDPSPAAQALYTRLKGSRGQPALSRPAEPAGWLNPPGSGQDREPEPALPAPPDHPRSALPMQFTRLFGRDAEVAELSRCLAPEDDLARPRVVTLAGPGGTGKTRLAIEAARALEPAYAGRVWFAGLADVEDPQLIGDVVCGAMRLPQGSSDDPLVRIAAEASRAPALLVLDNAEHLAPGAAHFVAAMRRMAPELRFAVTTRRRLAIPGERLFPVRPLPTPSVGRSAAATSAFASVRLFVDRAQAVRPDFQVTPRNCDSVARLCDRLDGIPLALELAASRIRTLTPEQILTRLDGSLEVLQDRGSPSAKRHASLNDAIAWSVGLLSPTLRRFFLALGLLRGAFDVEAAERVCGDPEALELLTQLCERSLLKIEESAGEMRFRMLETIREYTRAAISPPELARASRRHTVCFLKRAEAAEAGMLGAQQLKAVQATESDIENIRESMRRCVASGDAAMLARFAAALGRFWWIQGRMREGAQWLEEALKQPERVPAAVRAAVYHWAGTLAWARDRHAEAIDHHTKALAIHRKRRNTVGAARSLGSLGNIARQQGNDIDARRFYEESLEMFRRSGDVRGAATSLLNLGTVLEAAGEHERALACYRESRRLYEQIGDLHGVAFALANMAPVACIQGDFAEARDHGRRSLQLRRDLGDELGTLTAMAVLGRVAQSEQSDWRAAVLFSASEALHASGGHDMTTLFRSELAESLRILRERMGPSQSSSAEALGGSLSLDAAIEYALKDESPDPLPSISSTLIAF